MNSKSRNVSAGFPGIRDFILLGIVWTLAIFLVNPTGNFPLNDDWIYAFTVEKCLLEGKLHFLNWASTRAYPHVFIGIISCFLFGFSQEVLRFSTILLGFAGILTTYALLKQAEEPKQKQTIPLLGALLLAVNPIYLELSNTFMTDVPFYVVFVTSVYYFSRFLKNNSNRDLWLGTGWACLAIAYRQFGIVAPLAFSATLLFRKIKPRRNILMILAPALCAIGVFWFINQSYGGVDPTAPMKYHGYWDHFLRPDIAGNALYLLKICIAYSGLFFLPLLIFITSKIIAQSSGNKIMPSLFILSLVAVAGVWWGAGGENWMPFAKNIGNIMTPWGLGPFPLKGNAGGFFSSLAAHPVFWSGVTVFSFFGAVLFLFFCIRAAWQTFYPVNDGKPSDGNRLFAALMMLIYFLILVFFPQFYDRYLLVFFPSVFMILSLQTVNNAAQPLKNARKISWVGFLILAVMGIFSVAGTHDYLWLNRTRWKATQELMEKEKISPERIDGGYEFNGHFLYHEKYQPTNKTSWWWVDRDDYVIALRPLKENGYEHLRSYEYPRWLFLSPERVLILKKMEAVDA